MSEGDLKKLFFNEIIELANLSKKFAVSKKNANSLNNLLSILFKIYVYLDQNNKTDEIEEILKNLKDFIKNEK